MDLLSCRTCAQAKPADNFYLLRRGSTERQPVCKDCTKARKRATYAARRAGDLPTASCANSICPDCARDLPASAFDADHARETGLKLYCKECCAERLRIGKYGIKPGAYREAVAAQGGACSICGEVARLVVDHDHETGAIRGFICDSCNVGLGRFRDDPDRLLAAAAYLLARADVLTLAGE